MVGPLGGLTVTAKPAFAADAELKQTPEFEYLELQPLNLPIITESGLSQTVSLVVALELPYGKMEEVKRIEPRLADAYLQDLYGTLGAGHGMMKGNVVDIQAVKQRLTEITHRIAGEELVTGVLLQVLQQRRAL